MDTTPFVESFQDITQRFVKLLDSLSALRALSSLEVGYKDETWLLKFALRVLLDNQDMDRCSVFLKRGEELVCASGHAWNDGESGQSHAPADARKGALVFRVGEGISGLAASTGELQHCRDCSRDERFASRTGDKGATAPGSIISVPIKSAGDILGVLNISHPRAHYFTASDERILRVYANFLGFMLANSRHVYGMQEEIRNRTEQLETALEQAQELKERYERLSVVDELTGLHNRRFFFPETQAVLARAARSDAPTSLMLIDIDRFKGINDTYGHGFGDQVLKKVADVLREQARESDIVARLGGEEFALVLPNTDMEAVEPMAERIRGAFKAARWSPQSPGLRVTVTIGVACWRTESSGIVDTEAVLKDLLRHADEVLYQGKQGGRDQVRYYTGPKVSRA